MKTKNLIAVTLTGVLGLAGSAGLMRHASDKIQASKEVIPQRFLESSEEALQLRGPKYGNKSFEKHVFDPEIAVAREKYRGLIAEQETYLANPEISQAVEDYNTYSAVRVGAGALGVVSCFGTFFGTLGLFGHYAKRKKD